MLKCRHFVLVQISMHCKNKSAMLDNRGDASHIVNGNPIIPTDKKMYPTKVTQASGVFASKLGGGRGKLYFRRVIDDVYMPKLEVVPIVVHVSRRKWLLSKPQIKSIFKRWKHRSRWYF
jgi:hypothetical protein